MTTSRDSDKPPFVIAVRTTLGIFLYYGKDGAERNRWGGKIDKALKLGSREQTLNVAFLMATEHPAFVGRMEILSKSEVPYQGPLVQTDKMQREPVGDDFVDGALLRSRR